MNPHPLIGDAATLGWVALKAFLLYLTAIIGFRISKRRTLAEMSPFDFVAAIAVGAIVGRVPNASTSYIAGAVTLVTVLVAHRFITEIRYFRFISKIVEHSPRLLVAHGQVLMHEIRRCGLTIDDLYGLLRERGVEDLSQLQYVVFEQRGKVSIITHSPEGKSDPGLVRDILAQTCSK